MNKMNLKDMSVHYEKISAFDMLADIAKIAGVASIQIAPVMSRGRRCQSVSCRIILAPG